MKLLQDKVAVVTGGTRGIGAATVRTYLQQGAKVALWGSRPQTVEKALSKLSEEMPNACVKGYAPNLLEPESIADALEQVVSDWGRLDILVNNAGVSARESLYEYAPSAFQKTMDLNVKAVFLCAQAAARIMKAQGGGVILNTSSMVSLYGQPAGVAYPASKFAVNGLTKSLARELGRDNIRVNAVAPGIIRTDMVAALPESMIAPMVASVPLGRIGEPADIANAFLFLASDLASYITGEILSVDGAAMV